MSMFSGKLKPVKYIIALTCGLLIGGVAMWMLRPAPKSTDRLEGAGYDKPEEAVEAYLEALKDGNLEAMLSTFAIETYVEHYDIEEVIESSGGLSFNMSLTLKPIDEYTESINIARRQGELVNNSFYPLYWHLNDMGEYFGTPMAFREGREFDSTEDFRDELMEPDWMDQLSELKYGKVKLLEDFEDVLEEADSDDREIYEAEVEAKCEKLGCDELKCVAVEVEFDGEEYYFGMDVGRYGDKWYNCTPGGVSSYFWDIDSTTVQCGFYEK